MTGTGDLKGAKYNAYCEELREAIKSTIDTLIEIADKYNVYRTSVVEDFMQVFRGIFFAGQYLSGMKKSASVDPIPKVCGILGIKPYEEFYYNYEKEVYIVNNAGRLMFRRESDKNFYYTTSDIIYDMIEHPELIRKKV